MSNFFRELSSALGLVDIGRHSFDEATDQILRNAERVRNGDAKCVFVGNGGSAAIASHMAVDWQKAARYRSMCLNDLASLTCLGNDLGYAHVFSQPLAYHLNDNDVLFAISSSGRSPSILNAVDVGRAKHAFIVTFSGFDSDNPLRQLGHINFYVPSRDYGIVECAHLALIHAMLNEAIRARQGDV